MKFPLLLKACVQYRFSLKINVVDCLNILFVCFFIVTRQRLAVHELVTCLSVLEVTVEEMSNESHRYN